MVCLDYSLMKVANETYIMKVAYDLDPRLNAEWRMS